MENEAQPEKFGSITESIWWATVSLATVGYGDVYPITVGGKAFAALFLWSVLEWWPFQLGLLALLLLKKSLPLNEEKNDSQKLLLPVFLIFV